MSEKLLNWMEAEDLQGRCVPLQSRDGGAIARKGPDDWHDVDGPITEHLSDFDFRIKPGVALFRRADGSIEGPVMTAGALIDFLSTVPRDMAVVGTWEGIHVPVKSATVAGPPYYAGPFVELDVDQ